VEAVPLAHTEQLTNLLQKILRKLNRHEFLAAIKMWTVAFSVMTLSRWLPTCRRNLLSPSSG
jgi:hypothetical protein